MEQKDASLERAPDGRGERATLWKRERSERVAALTRRGMALMAAEGGKPGCAPLGYVNRREGSRTWVEIDPNSAPLVREAFELAATGEYSLRRLLRVMTEKGLRSRRGNALSISALRHLITNTFYAGNVLFAGTVFKGNHSRIIDEGTFVMAQGRFASLPRAEDAPVPSSSL